MDHQDWTNQVWTKPDKTKVNKVRHEYHMNDKVRQERNLIVESETGEGSLVQKKFDRTFINKVIEFRVKNKLKQKDLALRARVTPKMIQDLESGRLSFNSRLKSTLCKFVK